MDYFDKHPLLTSKAESPPRGGGFIIESLKNFKTLMNLLKNKNHLSKLKEIQKLCKLINNNK